MSYYNTLINDIDSYLKSKTTSIIISYIKTLKVIIKLNNFEIANYKKINRRVNFIN